MTSSSRIHLLALFSCVLLDQLSKHLVERLLPLGSRVTVAGPVVLTHVRNEGGAFGLFQGSPVRLALCGAGLLCVVALWWWFDSSAHRSGWGLVFLASGSIGNFVDRLARGAVIDFIDVGYWPVFNFADSLIVIGVLMLSWAIVSGMKHSGSSSGVCRNQAD